MLLICQDSAMLEHHPLLRQSPSASAYMRYQSKADGSGFRRGRRGSHLLKKVRGSDEALS